MNQLVNSTVLSNFAAVQQLDLLRNHPNDLLFIPTEIYHEIQEGQQMGYTFYTGIERFLRPFATNGWLQLVTMNEDELLLLASLPPKLHSGEAACLCIARNRGWGFLTDDKAARKQAKVWNIPVSGTLGILVLAVENGQLGLEEGNLLLNEIILRANYRSPISDLAQLLSTP